MRPTDGLTLIEPASLPARIGRSGGLASEHKERVGECLARQQSSKFDAISTITKNMPDASAIIAGAIAGAVSGSLSAAALAWLTAPSRAEREERGKRRADGRREIAEAARAFHYDLGEARRRLYRKSPVMPRELESSAVRFAALVRRGSTPLPRSERFRVLGDARTIVGPGVWRLAELRPTAADSPNTANAATLDGAALKVVAETRHWLTKADFTPTLATTEPTDRRWDALLMRVRKLQRRYPV